jgi:hypothetical protein
MKRLTFLFMLAGLISGTALLAQDKYFTRTGHIYFISHTDVIDIEGNNHQVGSIINVKTGEMVFTVLIKSFEFTLATAEEHFNETYMESDEYPKAKFKGKINEIAGIDITKPGKYDVHVAGDLTIHGQTNSIDVPAKIEVSGGKIKGKCDFSVHLDDYKIKVPKVVENRVAKIINVKVEMNYEPYNK